MAGHSKIDRARGEVADTGMTPPPLFNIERREVIGTVYDADHGKPPVITAFQIVGEHINNLNQNGDRSFARFEFEYDDATYTVEREMFAPRD